MDARAALAGLRSASKHDRDAAAAWMATTPTAVDSVVEIATAPPATPQGYTDALQAAIFLRDRLPAMCATRPEAEQTVVVQRFCGWLAGAAAQPAPLVAQMCALVAGITVRSAAGTHAALLAALHQLLAQEATRRVGLSLARGSLDAAAAVEGAAAAALHGAVTAQLTPLLLEEVAAGRQEDLMDLIERALGVYDPHAGLWFDDINDDADELTGGGTPTHAQPAPPWALVEACYRTSTARGDIALLAAAAKALPLAEKAAAVGFAVQVLGGVGGGDGDGDDAARHAGLVIIRCVGGGTPAETVTQCFHALLRHARDEVCYTALACCGRAAQAHGASCATPLLAEVMGRMERSSPTPALLDALAATAEGAGDSLRSLAPQAFSALAGLVPKLPRGDDELIEAAIDCLETLIPVYAHDDAGDACFTALCDALPALANALLPCADVHHAARLAAVIEGVTRELTSDEAHQAATEALPPLLAVVAGLATDAGANGAPRYLPSILAAFGAVGYAARWYGGAGEAVAAALNDVFRSCGSRDVLAAAVECAAGLVAVHAEEGLPDHGLAAAGAQACEAALRSDDVVLQRAGFVFASRVGMACMDDAAGIVRGAVDPVAFAVLQRAVDNPHPSRTVSPDLHKAQISALELLGSAAVALSADIYKATLLEASTTVLLVLLRSRDASLRHASAYALERVIRSHITPDAPQRAAVVDAGVWLVQHTSSQSATGRAAAGALAAGLVDTELVPAGHPGCGILKTAAEV